MTETTDINGTSPLIRLIQLAGVLQLLIVAMNVPLPRILRYREELAAVSPIIRQVFIVHSAYIVLMLIGFSALCFRFAPDLAGDSALGTFLSGCLAVFWGLRVPIQLCYYDAGLKRRYWIVHGLFTLAIVFMTGLFSFAALRGMR